MFQRLSISFHAAFTSSFPELRAEWDQELAVLARLKRLEEAVELREQDWRSKSFLSQARRLFVTPFWQFLLAFLFSPFEMLLAFILMSENLDCWWANILVILRRTKILAGLQVDSEVKQDQSCGWASKRKSLHCTCSLSFSGSLRSCAGFAGTATAKSNESPRFKGSAETSIPADVRNRTSFGPVHLDETDWLNKF